MNSSIIQILYVPQYEGVNPYMQINMEIIGSLENVELVKLPTLKEVVRRPLKFILGRPYDLVILNWLEHWLEKDGALSALGVTRFVARLLFMRLAGVRLVYVRHNIFPHGLKGKRAAVSKWLIDMAERVCDARVAHSGHMKDDGYHYIPHPIFPVDASGCTTDAKTKQYYIIFGRIVRYKNIERVIEQWGSEASGKTLMVVGAAIDRGYARELVALSQGRAVDINPTFVSEPEAQVLVQKARGLIIAHAEADVIVSASFFFAISNGTPVYAVETPFLAWAKNDLKLPGLSVFPDVVSLVAGLAHGGRTDLNRNDIRQRAEAEFGTEVTREAWGRLLRKLGLPLEK